MIKETWKKYKQLFFYGVFGVLTTVINILVYMLCFDVLHISNVLSTIIAWVAAVAFAFITNKLWVFDSNEFSSSILLSELWKFISCRVLTGVIDLGIMFVGVDLMHGPSTAIKVGSNILVIILNYLLSKLVIFKKSEHSGS